MPPPPKRPRVTAATTTVGEQKALAPLEPRLGLLDEREVGADEDELVYPIKQQPARVVGRRRGGGEEEGEVAAVAAGEGEDSDEDGVDMIEVVLNDRLGKKVRVKCNSNDTVRDLKLVTAAQTGTRPEKLRFQKWYTVLKDHITLADYEIKDGMNLELYYN